MPIKFGVMVPQGWRMDLVDFPDPVEAFEAMKVLLLLWTNACFWGEN